MVPPKKKGMCLLSAVVPYPTKMSILADEEESSEEEEEEEETSSEEEGPTITRKAKFDDEEDESDVRLLRSGHSLSA